MKREEQMRSRPLSLTLDLLFVLNVLELWKIRRTSLAKSKGDPYTSLAMLATTVPKSIGVSMMV